MPQSIHHAGIAVLTTLCMTAPRTHAVDFEPFLPKETDLVMSLNVRQLLDSPLGKKYAADLVKLVLARNKQIEQALNSLALDPLTDLTRVTTGVGLDDLSNPKGIVVVEGKFDVAKINGALEQLAKTEPQKLSIEKVNGKTLYQLAAPELPLPMYAAVVDTTLLAFSPDKLIATAAFDAAKSPPPTAIKKGLAGLLTRANRQSSLFITAYTKGKLDAIPAPDAQKKLIEQIHSVTAELNVGQNIWLELTVGASGRDDAKKMLDIAGSGIDLLKVQVKVAVAAQPEYQPLLDLANTLTAVQKDKQVIVSGKLTGAGIAKMLKK